MKSSQLSISVLNLSSEMEAQLIERIEKAAQELGVELEPASDGEKVFVETFDV